MVTRNVDDVVLAAGGVHVHVGSLELLGELLPGDGPAALVADAHVAGIHGADAQLALGRRLASTHTVPSGEEAKTAAVCERLWQELRLDRGGTVVAFGGGTTGDVTGFVAATYLRGVAWAAVPTTLVAQVDAAVGGKTAIDLPQGKNLVGAFHWPVRTVIDPALLETLPESERRAGLAEVVKTGLLAGEPLWELPDAELSGAARSSRPPSACAIPTTAASELSSISGTRRTRARGGRGLRGGQRTARQSHWGLRAALRLSVEHLGLDAAVADEVEAVLALGAGEASTSTAPGRRSAATRRPRAAASARPARGARQARARRRASRRGRAPGARITVA